jgi:hypothetical protein
MLTMLQGLISMCIDWTASALTDALTSSDATQTQLDGAAAMANALFNNLAVFGIILAVFWQLLASSFKMKPIPLLLSIVKAVGAVALFRIVLWLLTNHQWSVIILFDHISSGVMTGLGLDPNSLKDTFHSLIPVWSGLAGFAGDIAGAAIPGAQQAELIPEIMILLLAGLVWLLGVLFMLIMQLRLLAVLVGVATLCFGVMFLPMAGSGPRVLRRWGLALLALLSAKPLAVVIIAMGVQFLTAAKADGTQGGGFDLPRIVAAIMFLAFASASPLLSLRFFGWMDLQRSAQESSAGHTERGKQVASTVWNRTQQAPGRFRGVVGHGAAGAVAGAGVQTSAAAKKWVQTQHEQTSGYKQTPPPKNLGEGSGEGSEENFVKDWVKVSNTGHETSGKTTAPSPTDTGLSEAGRSGVSVSATGGPSDQQTSAPGPRHGAAPAASDKSGVRVSGVGRQ